MSARRLAESLAKEATRWIAIGWGEALGFRLVCGHPKSGGTWLAQMVSDYLQLPYPRRILLPVAFECVIQNHWPPHPRFPRSLYLYRDGRDVMVSLYFHHMRVAHRSRQPQSERTRRVYQRLFGPGYDPADITRHLPRFIRHEFDRPGRGSRLHWRQHVTAWRSARGPRPPVVLRYEDLRANCLATLGAALTELQGEPPDPWRLATAVEKFSMERQTGRRPGQESRHHVIRRGVVGDWRRHFDREAAEVFDHYAGQLLIELGYEPGHGWVERCGSSKPP